MNTVTGPCAHEPCERCLFDVWIDRRRDYNMAGVTTSGIDTATAVLNCRTHDILKQSGASLTFLSSENVSKWPEYLRRKIECGEVARGEGEMDV